LVSAPSVANISFLDLYEAFEESLLDDEQDDEEPVDEDEGVGDGAR
jgi:hypothetical protein